MSNIDFLLHPVCKLHIIWRHSMTLCHKNISDLIMLPVHGPLQTLGQTLLCTMPSLHQFCIRHSYLSTQTSYNINNVFQDKESGNKQRFLFLQEDTPRNLNMSCNFYAWSLRCGLVYFINISSKCETDFFKWKQFLSINGYPYYGKVIAVYEVVPLRICVTSCPTYSECRRFSMSWINLSRTVGTTLII